MAIDPEIFRHKEWLGLLQPVGLVISPPALVKAQAFIDRTRTVEVQEKLLELVSTEPISGSTDQEKAWIKDFPAFAEQVLQWLPEDLVGAPELESLPEALEIVLPDYGETLKPTYAVRDSDSDSWLMLIQKTPLGQSLDEVDPTVEKGQGWKATIQEKFERLLRETAIPIGLLDNGTHLRLVYAPRGESSGHLTFPVQAMCEVPGRLILGALEMLLGADRLFNVPTERRLPKLLSDSRDYQAEVSNKLADQVLDALWELLRGFQTADAAINGKLLSEIARTEPQHIYGGLITTLMRLVFLLYAEDQGLMPGDDIYQRNYAVTGLYERLREDAGNYPDTMDQRYGAWSWLLSLFRLVYDGGGSTPEYLPARHGQLFNPDEYPFLEGRTQTSCYSEVDSLAPPRIPDGVIYRLLEKLLVLDGERLSYRALDVEQIGSVYEAIMGFEVKVAPGLSIALRPKDVVVNVEDILKAKPKDREKLLQEADCKPTGKALSALKEAKTPQEIVAALDRRVSLSRTPNLLPVGSLYLQPGEERRRTGSHYTPRKLTQPIVETTLRPVLAALGEYPRAEQILSLKVCDLAMGSGAFLVEACRQLGEKVMEAWSRDDQLKDVPDDVEPLLAARRLVAQRCLYGVDKNPFAVNLAKLSLWLVTLAKDRPFTFLDHALKCGDSLVGLTRSEIGSFAKDPIADLPLLKLIKEKVDRAKSYRTEIQALDTLTDQDAEDKLTRLQQAESELEDARLTGDVAVAAFFDGASKSKKEREELQEEYAALVREWRQSYLQNKEVENHDLTVKAISNRLRSAEKIIAPFNWEIEFPEVFDRENPGFDAIVGNPPFAGKNTTINGNAEGYLEWLKEIHAESHGNSDLVAHFFRRAFTILRKQGSFGLIATNTIAQGDTRSTGLRYICENGGWIYNAQKRLKWPGLAAVVVSVVNIQKSQKSQQNIHLSIVNAVNIQKSQKSQQNIHLSTVNAVNISKSQQSQQSINLSAVNAVNIPKSQQSQFLINSSSNNESSLQKAEENSQQNSSQFESFQQTSALAVESDLLAKQSIKITLNGREVPLISAFLFHAGGNANPAVLLANANKSFVGSYVLGMGFTFDDSNPDATSLAEMHRLIEQNPQNKDCIFPYIGGEEVNSKPDHAYHRYVINFFDMSEEEAWQYPDLMQIVKEKVKPERDTQKRDALRIRWWQYAEKRPGLVKAIAQCDQVLVISRVGQHGSFSFLPSGMVYSESLVVFPLPNYSSFCTLQSRIHEIWARFFGSSMKDDLRYTPSDCFETFPFPLILNPSTGGESSQKKDISSSPILAEGSWEMEETLETVGKEYYEFRAELMIRNNQGLTATYNRFHDPDERDSDILKLRELHAKMDRAVLDAYGWTDIPTTCEFLLDYEEEDLTSKGTSSEAEGRRQKKKPWRYRWSEEIHDEVLARLLDLNQKRYEAEILGGKQAETQAKSKKSRKPKATKSTKTNVQQPNLFGE